MLARRFKSLHGLEDATQEQLLEIDGIGPVLAETVTAWAGNDSNTDLLDRLRAAGVDPVDETPDPPAEHPMRGVTFVVTGRLESLSRSEAQSRIKALGGKTSSSVSKKTGYLVAGEEAGSKLDNAIRLGVPVLDEEQFMRFLDGEAPEVAPGPPESGE